MFEFDEEGEERREKISRVEDRRRENWRGVRRGVLCGAEGKMEMWRGLFWFVLVNGCFRAKDSWKLERGGETVRFCLLCLCRQLKVLLP